MEHRRRDPGMREPSISARTRRWVTTQSSPSVVLSRTSGRTLDRPGFRRWGGPPPERYPVTARWRSTRHRPRDRRTSSSGLVACFTPDVSGYRTARTKGPEWILGEPDGSSAGSSSARSSPASQRGSSSSMGLAPAGPTRVFNPGAVSDTSLQARLDPRVRSDRHQHRNGGRHLPAREATERNPRARICHRSHHGVGLHRDRPHQHHLRRRRERCLDRRRAGPRPPRSKYKATPWCPSMTGPSSSGPDSSWASGTA